MPDIADVAWSERDDRNSEAVPDGWPQGTMPAYVDETGRMMMGAVKRFWNKINPIYQTSGTGDTYVVQTEVGVDQINLYELLCVRIDRSNVGTTPTLQFGSTNPRTIVKAGPSGYIPLAAGDMYGGNSHTFWYNGAFYILTDPSTVIAGTVTSVSVVPANGLAGTVSTATTTPAITLSTSVTGILQGDGTGISAATTTGSGSVALANSPALVTPTLGAATATSVNKVAITPPATGATITIPDGVTLTGPAASGTAMTLGNAETVTGAKTYSTGKLILAGGTSGTTLLNATAIASGTLTLPAATDTLVGRATTDTLSNKTFSDQPAVRSNLVVPTYVASIAALQALDTTKDTVAILTQAGRGGTFIWTTGNLSAQITADTSQGVYVKATAIASTVGAWVRSYSLLNVEFFGASVGASASANATAIQCAVNIAQLYTGYLYFPALYSTNAAILVSNNIVLEGVSAFTSGITCSTGAAISLIPSTSISNNNTWYGIRYLSIISTDAGAHYGIEYASTGSEYLSNWETAGCYISGTSGGASFDSTGSTVGIFSCTLRRNWFNNGLVIKDGGDSITLLENTINGAGIGVFVNALKTGARQLILRNNNISARSECVYLLNVTGAIIDQNWMETPSYLGSYTGTTGALLYTQASPNTRISRNTIQPLAAVGGGFVPAAYSIYLNTSGAQSIIRDNDIAIGGTGHIQIGAGVSSTLIDWDNKFDVTPVITDAGTGTFGAGNTPGVFNQPVKFSTTAQFVSPIAAESTNSGTGNGPYFEVYRNKPTPFAAVSDGIGGFLWYGNNSAGTKTNLGYLTMTWNNVTAGAEAGTFNIARMQAGALVIAVTFGTIATFSTGATFVGAILSTSATGGIGYATGAGGTVTQATSRTTGVTINKVSGAITTNSTSLAAASTAKFTVTNSAVAATDNIVLTIASGTTTDQTDVKVQNVAAGSFNIVVANRHASTAETGAIVINFAIVKSVTS